MILDTAFIIDVMDGDDDAIRAYETYEDAREQQYLASITVLELYEGIERSLHSDAERRKVRGVIDTKPVIPADRAVMKKAGKISGRLITEGNEIDREDCAIAATALIEEEPVVTRNVEHFERIDGIEVRPY
ncbi:MAG TPA: type II toxin-antitoxin system VapC family toxin [Halococcus sp.]|nr:type II toxin-antitoxin system VapC family toxin [Halococcus sp.]